MAQCYNCQVEISAENTSLEHVIPNACGGRLKSSDLLCKKCNNFFGDKFDARLAEQTNHLANLLIIKRDRDDPRPIRAEEIGSGDIVDLQYGKRPVRAIPKMKEEFEGDILHAQFSTGKEKQLTDYLKSLKKRYPGFYIDDARKTVQRSSEYLSSGVKFDISVGGQDTFRSITKSAINFYMLRGGDRWNIQHLLPYIQGAEGDWPCMIHYPEYLVYKPDTLEVSHVIKVVGDPDTKTLYAYIEIFNCHNFIVLLNGGYLGSYFNETYIFDVVAQKELRKPLEINYSRSEINAYLKVDIGSKIWEIAKERINRILAVVDKVQVDLAITIVMDDVLKKSLFKYEDGTTLTQEQMDEFNEVFAKEFSLFLEHRSNGVS